MRVLLLRVDESHKPGHDQVGETRALGEVVGIEELDFVREVVAAPLLDFFLSSRWAPKAAWVSFLCLRSRHWPFLFSPCSGRFLLALLLLAESAMTGRLVSLLVLHEHGYGTTYPSPRLIGFHLVQLTLHVRDLLSDPLMFLDGMHRTDMQELRAEEEDL